MIKKNGLLVKELDYATSETRDRITNVLGAEMFSLVKTLSDELEELDLEEVSTEEFMVAVEGALHGLYLDRAEEEAPEE